MKKSRFTETQIVKAIQEHETGRKAEDICRELGITTASFYKWRQRYGGMVASDVKKMKEIQAPTHYLIKRHIRITSSRPRTFLACI
jgi:putative transposase